MKLHVDEYHLKVIAEDQRLDAEGALRAMLDKWLDICEDPTWRGVVDALRAMQKKRLAKQLETKFCPGMCS